MKTDLQITGRVELTHDDISKAVTMFLQEKFDYRVSRVIYPENPNIRIIVEVNGKLNNGVVEDFKSKEIHNRKGCHGKIVQNIGVFDTMRSLLNDAFIKNGKKEVLIKYHDFRNDVFSFHPKMDDKKLRVYLGDRRQLGTNVYWNTKMNQIVVRSIINH